MARYDALLLAMRVYPLAMLVARVETPREFACIFTFHLPRVGLEMWKVAHGGWSHPEPAWSKVSIVARLLPGEARGRAASGRVSRQRLQVPERPKLIPSLR